MHYAFVNAHFMTESGSIKGIDILNEISNDRVKKHDLNLLKLQLKRDNWDDMISFPVHCLQAT